MMEHKQDHFNHDIRKKERETLQLKERLSKKIMEKKTEKGKTTKSLLDVASVVQSIDSGWSPPSSSTEQTTKNFLISQQEPSKY